MTTRALIRRGILGHRTGFAYRLLPTRNHSEACETTGMNNEWALAIDFGTSYTVRGGVRLDEAAVIVELDGAPLIPSLVFVDRERGLVVGRAAEALAGGTRIVRFARQNGASRIRVASCSPGRYSRRSSSLRAS